LVMTLEFQSQERTAARLLARLVVEAGIDDLNDALAIESAMVRHCSARLGRTTRQSLIEATETTYSRVLLDVASAPIPISDIVDELIASGDILSGREGGRNHLYLSPPMFVRRRSGSAFLLGGHLETGLPFVEGMVSRGQFRELAHAPDDMTLRTLGFGLLPTNVWIAAPSKIDPREFLGRLDAALDAAGPAGDVSDVVLFDPNKRRDYYLGRLTPSGRATGRFVARRTRRWSGPIWCYAEFREGVMGSFVDLPVVDARFSSRDEAWWGICAIDATLRQPQRLVTRNVGGATEVSAYSPLPSWAQRRLLSVGRRSPRRTPGTLATFLVPDSEISEEVAFLSSNLWLAVQVGEPEA
jgi:hypothetical protein